MSTMLMLRISLALWASRILPVTGTDVFWNDTSTAPTIGTTSTLRSTTSTEGTFSCRTTVTYVNPVTVTATNTNSPRVVTSTTTITTTITYQLSSSSPQSSIQKRYDQVNARDGSVSRITSGSQPSVLSRSESCLTITFSKIPTYTVTQEIEKRTSVLTQIVTRTYLNTPSPPAATDTTGTQGGSEHEPEPSRTSTWSTAIATLPIPEPRETFSFPPVPNPTSSLPPAPGANQPPVLPPSSRTPTPIGTFLPLPPAANPGNQISSSPGFGLHLPNGATLLPGSATSFPDQFISLPATPSFIQINSNTLPLISVPTTPASSQPQNGGQPGSSEGGVPATGKPTYTVGTSPLPLSLFSTYLLAGSKNNVKGGAKPLFSLTLSDGHILSLSSEDLNPASGITQRTYTYKGHVISLSYNHESVEIELMVDSQRISSFSPILASRVMGSGGSLFSFESIIGGAVRLFDGEVGLVSVDGMGGDGDIESVLGMGGVSVTLEDGAVVVTGNQSGGGEGGTDHAEKESEIKSTSGSRESALLTELPVGLFSTEQLVPSATQTSASAVTSESFGETRCSAYGKRILAVWLIGHLVVI